MWEKTYISGVRSVECGSVRAKWRHGRSVFFLWSLGSGRDKGSMTNRKILPQLGVSLERPGLEHNKGNGKGRKQKQRKTSQQIL